MTEVQAYILGRLLDGWKMIADRPWYADLKSPDRTFYRPVKPVTLKSMAHAGWIEPGDVRHGESYWRITQLGEQALNEKRSRRRTKPIS